MNLKVCVERMINNNIARPEHKADIGELKSGMLPNMSE